MIDKNTIEQILFYMDLYSETDRVSIALNVRKALQNKINIIKEKEQCEWIAELGGYSDYKTVYCWLSPHREAKVPFKVVLQIALKTNIPLDEFFRLSENNSKLSLRTNQKIRIENCETQIAEYIKNNPNATIKKISSDLKLAEETVRRHLRNLGVIEKYLVNSGRKKRRL